MSLFTITTIVVPVSGLWFSTVLYPGISPVAQPAGGVHDAHSVRTLGRVRRHARVHRFRAQLLGLGAEDPLAGAEGLAPVCRSSMVEITSPAVEANEGFQLVAFLTLPRGFVCSLIPDR